LFTVLISCLFTFFQSCLLSCCSLTSSFVLPWLVPALAVRSLKRNLLYMMTIAFMTHNMGKLNLKFFWNSKQLFVYIFYSLFIYIYFRYTNNGKAYSESDYGSEYGMMDNGDGDAGRGLLKKLISSILYDLWYYFYIAIC